MSALFRNVSVTFLPRGRKEIKLTPYLDYQFDETKSTYARGILLIIQNPRLPLQWHQVCWLSTPWFSGFLSTGSGPDQIQPVCTHSLRQLAQSRPKERGHLRCCQALNQRMTRWQLTRARTRDKCGYDDIQASTACRWGKGTHDIGPNTSS